MVSHLIISIAITSFQKSTTILNACIKNLETYWVHQVYIYIYIYIDTHTRARTHTHTYTHTHTHTHIYIYIYIGFYSKYLCLDDMFFWVTLFLFMCLFLFRRNKRSIYTKEIICVKRICFREEYIWVYVRGKRFVCLLNEERLIAWLSQSEQMVIYTLGCEPRECLFSEN